MAASDYFPDLPDTGDMLESIFRKEGMNYTKIDSTGITKYKQINFGPDMEPGSLNFGKDMIFEDERYIPLQHSTNHRGKFKTGNMSKETLELKKKEEVLLPDDVTPVKENTPPKDLIVISIPKMGKGSIFGDFTAKYNALVFGLEKGGYEYIPARKLEIHKSDETTQWEAFQSYIKYRNALKDQKGKYDYLIIDGLTDLDELSVIGGTLAYMDTVIGKNFNRFKDGQKIPYGDSEWKSVLTLADGAGYQHTRKWFLEQVDIFKQIAPYRLYAAHVADKTIKDNGKEEVLSTEIALTGQLKRIFASKVTSLAKLIADGDDRYLNFEVANDSIIAGSRAPQLEGKILISKKLKGGKIETYWDKIYPNKLN